MSSNWSMCDNMYFMRMAIVIDRVIEHVQDYAHVIFSTRQINQQ